MFLHNIAAVNIADIVTIDRDVMLDEISTLENYQRFDAPGIELYQYHSETHGHILVIMPNAGDAHYLPIAPRT